MNRRNNNGLIFRLHDYVVSKELKNLSSMLLDLMHQFSKVARNQVNKPKSVVFLYISNKQLQNEILKVTITGTPNLKCRLI